MYLSHNNIRVSALCLYTVQEGFLDWAFTSGMYNNKAYFTHVTTENFRDWRSVLRRPMLVRGKHELKPPCPPARPAQLDRPVLAPRRSSIMCGPRSASAAAFCSTTPRSTTRTSAWRA